MSHLYSVRYRRLGHPGRVYRATVVARDADEALAFVRIRDPQFDWTTALPDKGREILDAPITPREERDEMRADHELMADEYHGRSW